MAEKLSRRKAMGLMGAAAAMAGLPSHVIWGQRGSYGGSTGQERGEMGRIICDRFRDPQSKLSAIVLDPRLEMELRRGLHHSSSRGSAIWPFTALAAAV